MLIAALKDNSEGDAEENHGETLDREEHGCLCGNYFETNADP